MEKKLDLKKELRELYRPPGKVPVLRKTAPEKLKTVLRQPFLI